jgi:hypothetical protein
MKRLRHSLAALMLIAPLALGACASKPTMRINHAEVTGVRLGFPPQLYVQLTVWLDVYNPNKYDVAIRAVRGQTVLAQRYSVPVDFRPEGGAVWLRGKSLNSVQVPVIMPVQTATAVLGEAFFKDSIPYRFQGSADVTATSTFKIESDDYSVDEQGWIPRDQIVRALPGIQ